MSEPLDMALDRADRLMRINAYEAAIEAWRDVLTMEPDMVDAHAGLALCLFERRRMTAARVEAKRALAGDAEHSGAMLVLVLCDYFGGHRKRAMARLDELLRIDPLDAEAHYLRAQFRRMSGHWDRAEDSIRKALQLHPGSPTYRLELGRIARERGDGARAGEIARELVGQDPMHVGALVLLGDVARDRGDVDEAYRLALSALSVDANDQEALALLAGVKLSRNPVGGLYWHSIRKLSESQLLWALWAIYLGYLLILTTMDHAGISRPWQYVFIALYLAWGVGIWMNRNLVDWMVRRELKSFRWQGNY